MKDQIIKLDTSRSEIQNWYDEITENQKTEVLNLDGQMFTVKNKVNWKEEKSFKNSDANIVRFFPVETDLYKSIDRYGKLYLIAYTTNNKVVGKLINISLNAPVGEILNEYLMRDIFKKSFKNSSTTESGLIELANYNQFISQHKSESTKDPEMSARSCMARYLVTTTYDGSGTEIARSERLLGIICTGEGDSVDQNESWDPTGFGSTPATSTNIIYNKVSDPCIAAIINSVMNSGINDAISTIFSYFGSTVDSNLTFADDSPPLGKDAQTTATFFDNGEVKRLEATINFNNEILENASKPYIATLIAHEATHAFFRARSGKQEPFNDWDHEEMSMKYVNVIADFVSRKYNIPYAEASSMSWRGLNYTKGFRESQQFDINGTIYDKDEFVRLSTEHLIGGKGNKCD